MKLLLALTLTFVATVVTSLAKPDNPPQQSVPYPQTSFFLSDPVPEDVTPTGNPLDWAGAKIGLDVRNFELPRAYENEYRFVARFPIIDAVSNRPLYMKQWTEENAEALMQTQATHGIKATGFALGVLTGDPQYQVPPRDNDSAVVAQLIARLAMQAFTPQYKDAIQKLFVGYYHANTFIGWSAFKFLSAEDSLYFTQNPVAFLLPDGEKMAELTGNTDTHLEYISHLRNVRLDVIMSEADILASAVNDYIEETKSYTPADYWIDPVKSATTLDITIGDIRIVISGTGDDLHSADAAILIDLGGNDTYTNNAGGANRNASICIDHAGNDTYDAKDRRYVQGCGLFGVGMLVDLAGNDKYTAKHFAQGAGIAGVGVLYDAVGNDDYSGHGFTQGAAMFGLGMLMDNEGDDSYDCATLSQGGAACMGLGILSDLSGNDKYKLGTDTGKNAFDGLPGYGQGGALSFRHSPWRGKFTPYGGVGFLIDGNGNDDYLTTGWCDQGGSYIMSLGALYDGGGNDHYKANTGQGSGIHITNAILIDKAGDDHYEGAFRTGGSGSDRSPGILIDYDGNDTYQSGSSSYGTGCKPFSYSLLIDYKGDDNYITANPVGPILFNCWDSFGGVWPESAPNLYPYAIFLDLGGNDDYQVRNRKNNSVRHSFGHGIQVDMEWQGGDVIGKVDSPLSSYGELDPQEALKPYTAINSQNLFTRFHAIGSLAQDPFRAGWILPEILEYRGMINSYPDWKFSQQHNRDALEVLHHFLIEKRSFQDIDMRITDLLLDCPDPEVRTIIADDIGVFGLKSCEDALVQALDDPEPQVRRFSYRSLMALKSDKGLEKAKVAVKKDSSEDVRRVALGYITLFSSTADLNRQYSILVDRLENDPASSVKVASADGLGRLGNAKTIKLLRQATKSYDVYVQRAAAKALCELGEVEGIGVLIESLSFPSIDAFYNYDYNVPNFIATYAGYDLPEPDRFEQSKWRDWFAENRDKIDLKENVASSKAFAALGDSLRGASDERLIELLEGFLMAHPGHRNAAGTLSANLNRIAWDLATAPKDSPRFDAEKAIRYSKRSVDLIPDPNYWDTLAEAYYAAGMFDESAKVCNEQLAKSPGNRMFLDRLEKIERIKK